MNKLVIGLLILAGTCVIWLYFSLGGNQPVVFQQSEVDIWFSGDSIKTRYSDSKIEALFKKARQMADEHEEAALTILNWPASKDTVHQTIGVTVNHSSDIPWAEHKRRIKGNFIKAVIEAHNLVMPKPDDVLREARAYAHEHDLIINEDWTLEVYRSSRSLEIYFPVLP